MKDIGRVRADVNKSQASTDLLKKNQRPKKDIYHNNATDWMHYAKTYPTS